MKRHDSLADVWHRMDNYVRQLYFIGEQFVP